MSEADNPYNGSHRQSQDWRTIRDNHKRLYRSVDREIGYLGFMRAEICIPEKNVMEHLVAGQPARYWRGYRLLGGFVGYATLVVMHSDQGSQARINVKEREPLRVIKQAWTYGPLLVKGHLITDSEPLTVSSEEQVNADLRGKFRTDPNGSVIRREQLRAGGVPNPIGPPDFIRPTQQDYDSFQTHLLALNQYNGYI